MSQVQLVLTPPPQVLVETLTPTTSPSAASAKLKDTLRTNLKKCNQVKMRKMDAI